jgi:hypothetical protein
MGSSFRSLLILLSGLALVGSSAAQTGPAKPSSRSAPPFKRFCQPGGGGFCVTYPASWSVLGEAFGDGIVVAPQQQSERALWDVVTVATIVPAAEDQPAPTLDEVIATAMSNLEKDGRNPQTLQRQERTVAGLPGQAIRIRYHDDEGRDWVEALVFIQGPEQEIYSVGLKAQPADMQRLEPAFDAMVRSWKLQSPPAASRTSGVRTGSSAKSAHADPKN